MTVTYGYSGYVESVFSKKFDMELTAIRGSDAEEDSALSKACGDLSLQVKRIDAVFRPGRRITPDQPGQLLLLNPGGCWNDRPVVRDFANLLADCRYSHG